MPLPRIGLTLGDVAGIGPEVVVRAWCEGGLIDVCRPVVIGHPAVLERAARLVRPGISVNAIGSLKDFVVEKPDVIPCWNPGADATADVPPGKNDARAGRAAFDYLVEAANAALRGDIDAITTAPLSKASLHLADLQYPGHTEILAELCGVREFAMLLHLDGESFQPRGNSRGLSVAHVTLHTSLRSVPDLLSEGRVLEKIRLIDRFLRDLYTRGPRIGVCALNPHAGEEGIFGDEEATVIAPAVEQALREHIDVCGPLPADTLLKRAAGGEFDGVVAMYHDQGHIALKLLGFHRAVNVTLGLPIVRTSPSHGTAFDIAWQGKASAAGMIEAVRLAARLAATRTADR
jgi:4-phospho-D-threonate 3-dehydrogenase / 4-phospho-D-erythronate 3-dehydrogenase